MSPAESTGTIHSAGIEGKENIGSKRQCLSVGIPLDNRSARGTLGDHLPWRPLDGYGRLKEKVNFPVGMPMLIPRMVIPTEMLPQPRRPYASLAFSRDLIAQNDGVSTNSEQIASDIIVPEDFSTSPLGFFIAL